MCGSIASTSSDPSSVEEASSSRRSRSISSEKKRSSSRARRSTSRVAKEPPTGRANCLTLLRRRRISSLRGHVVELAEARHVSESGAECAPEREDDAADGEDRTGRARARLLEEPACKERADR